MKIEELMAVLNRLEQEDCSDSLRRSLERKIEGAVPASVGGIIYLPTLSLTDEQLLALNNTPPEIPDEVVTPNGQRVPGLAIIVSMLMHTDTSHQSLVLKAA